MQLSKTSKILLITLLAIILIGSIFLVIKKQTNDIEKPITEVEGQAENQDQAIEPDTQDQVETDNQTDQDNANEEQTNNQTVPSDQPIIDPEPETTSNDQPTSSEITELDTTNWKTYTNEEYGFSFKYPGEWYLENYGRHNIIHLNDKPFPEEIPFEPIFSALISISSDNSVDNFKPYGLKLIKTRTMNGLSVKDYFYFSDMLNKDIDLHIIKIKSNAYVYYQSFYKENVNKSILQTMVKNKTNQPLPHAFY